MQDHIIAQSSHVFGYCSMYKIPNIRKIYKKKIQQIISSSHIRCSWSSMIWNIVTWVLLLFAWYLILRPFHLWLINTDALCLTHMGMGTHVICGARARPYHRQLRSCACFCIIRYERERERLLSCQRKCYRHAKSLAYNRKNWTHQTLWRLVSVDNWYGRGVAMCPTSRCASPQS